ncbi:phosphatase PAP2 family protein [Aquibacillus rhizosphaerae]|uniref:Phosphatase PAP2 family protein n=1 Tax=Aquibacillus rhizosphaerae TaxID=3051431 RepID=A0ABT7LBV7_9BACI|nr:phosphatase PAP2 family protein [Aquibacillus sp. LR5S19]MDL4842767.1 phosphatase PAP2 family protein [Aquibacillus sp. LR5S19]
MHKFKRNYFYVSFFILAVVSSILLTVRVISEDMPVIDLWASPLVANLDNTTIFSGFRWITELGSGTFITPFTILFSLFLWRFSKDWIASFMVVLGTFLGYRVNHWIKVLIERERPRIMEEAEGIGYSFPSGHAMGAMIAYGLYVYFLTQNTKSKRLKVWINIIGVLLIILIGFSRYVIRVHYISDVLAGYMFGFIFLMIWIGLYHLIVRMKKRFFYYKSQT